MRNQTISIVSYHEGETDKCCWNIFAEQEKHEEQRKNEKEKERERMFERFEEFLDNNVHLAFLS